jgi:plasmid stability protein
VAGLTSAATSSSMEGEVGLVAILKIENFPDDLLSRLEERAAKARCSVAQEVIRLLDEAVKNPKRQSILALQGLGKEVWKDVDSDAYLEAERQSWD